MALKKNIAVSADGFVFDASNGMSYTLNPCGVEIIEMLKQNAESEEIKKHIMKIYEVDNVTAEKDIMDFMDILYHHNLLEQ